MAAGIGEASAIAQCLQLGFSLATTLHTYIEHAKDAPDDIWNLANEIEITLGQVEELDALLRENETTKGWNKNGISLANKCRRDTANVVAKIARLLRKSGSNLPDKGIVERGDIDLSLFQKARWATLKPRVEVVKHELQRTRIDTLLARDCYNVKSSHSKLEQDLAHDRIVGLIKRKRRVKKDLRRAKREAKEVRQVGFEDASDSDDDDLGEVRSKKTSRHKERERSAFQRRPPGNNRRNLGDRKTDRGNRNSDTSSSEYESGIWDYDEVAGEVREEEKKKLDLQLQEAQQKKMAEEEAVQQKKKAEEAAVERYKKDLVDAAAKHRKQFNESMQRMSKAFEPPLSPEQARRFLEEEQKKNMTPDLAKLVEVFPSLALPAKVNERPRNLEPIQKVGSKPVEEHRNEDSEEQLPYDVEMGRDETKTRGMGAIFPFLRRSKSTAVRENPRETLTRYKSTAESKDGASDRELPILVSYDGVEWNFTVCSGFPLAEINRLSSSSLMTETMQTYSKMPSECRKAITQYIKSGDRKKDEWRLVFALSYDKKLPKGLRLIRRMSAMPQMQIPGQAYFMLYSRVKKKEKERKFSEDDFPTRHSKNNNNNTKRRAREPFDDDDFEPYDHFDQPLPPPQPFQPDPFDPHDPYQIGPPMGQPYGGAYPPAPLHQNYGPYDNVPMGPPPWETHLPPPQGPNNGAFENPFQSAPTFAPPSHPSARPVPRYIPAPPHQPSNPRFAIDGPPIQDDPLNHHGTAGPGPRHHISSYDDDDYPYGREPRYAARVPSPPRYRRRSHRHNPNTDSSRRFSRSPRPYYWSGGGSTGHRRHSTRHLEHNSAFDSGGSSGDNSSPSKEARRRDKEERDDLIVKYTANSFGDVERGRPKMSSYPRGTAESVDSDEAERIAAVQDNATSRRDFVDPPPPIIEIYSASEGDEYAENENGSVRSADSVSSAGAVDSVGSESWSEVGPPFGIEPE